MTPDDLWRVAPSTHEIDQVLARAPEDTGGVFPMEMEELQLLCAFGRYLDVAVAVETGSFTGSSAIALRMIPATTISIDDHQQPLIRERGPGFWIRDHWKRQTILWVNGRAMPALVAMDGLLNRTPPPYHVPLRWLFFHDSDHIEASVYEELDLAIGKLGALGIACHDVEQGKPIGTDRAFARVVAKYEWPTLTIGNIAFAWGAI